MASAADKHVRINKLEKKNYLNKIFWNDKLDEKELKTVGPMRYKDNRSIQIKYFLHKLISSHVIWFKRTVFIISLLKKRQVRFTMVLFKSLNFYLINSMEDIVVYCSNNFLLVSLSRNPKIT